MHGHTHGITLNITGSWSELARLLPDRYALFRVLQLLDAAQVMWQAVRSVASHNGDHNLWLQQRRLGLHRLLDQSRQLRRAAGHHGDQERPQQTHACGTHLGFQIRPYGPGTERDAGAGEGEGGWEGEREWEEGKRTSGTGWVGEFYSSHGPAKGCCCCWRGVSLWVKSNQKASKTS